MSKLSREQIKKIEDKTGLYSPAYLMCDGFHVTIKEYRNKNKIRACVYINHYLKGEWMRPESEYPESKFFPFMKIKVKKNIMKPKCRKMVTKTLDNRDFDFASIGQALRHINKVCDSVEVIED